MTRLRRNHTRSKSGGMALRFILFAILLMVLMWSLYRQMNQIEFSKTDSEMMVPASERFYLPTAQGQVVHHDYYSLSYIEKHEQAEWVAYRLTRDMLKVPNVERADRFNPDYDIKSRSALHRDYSNSGFTRGHLAPAGDMAHNHKAMQESFLMSNISPQKRKFNNGIWKELEENVRDWAYSRGEIYIVTGPILDDPISQKIGGNKVSVPQQFFKIILDVSSINLESIAFLIPNERSEKKLDQYTISIDQIEEITGIDFFYELLSDDEEERIESKIDVEPWKISDKRYRLRVEKWNLQ